MTASVMSYLPDLSLAYLTALIVPVAETLAMAAAAMLAACAFGIPLALVIASRLPGARLLYELLAGLRAIPDLTLAILCVVAFGIGAPAGVMALAIFYTAMIGKVFADLFLAADRAPLDALRATGASRLAVAVFGFLPLRLKDLLTHGCYSFECAVRAAVIVGAVGGGGLGTELVGTLNAFDYRRAATLILVLIAIMRLTDHAGWIVRRRPRLVLLFIPVGAIALWLYGPRLAMLGHAAATFAAMFPPSLPAEALARIPQLLAETVAIALFGTVLGAVLALPLALASTRGLLPKVIAGLARSALEAMRGVPEVVWGLVFVSLISIGPAVGIVAIGLHSAGVLGKLYAESFENVRIEPVQAIRSTGAGGFSTVCFALLPLALPPLAIHTLFRMEWNLRAATIVGMIGAGGIGEALYQSQQLFFYPQMMAYILITWLLVSCMDFLGQKTRQRAGCAYVPA